MSDEQAVTVSDDGLLALITVQAGEIERLRADNAKLRAEYKDAMGMLFNQAKTIKRLQDAVLKETNNA